MREEPQQKTGLQHTTTAWYGGSCTNKYSKLTDTFIQVLSTVVCVAVNNELSLLMLHIWTVDIVCGTLQAKLHTKDLSSGSNLCVLFGSRLLTPCEFNVSLKRFPQGTGKWQFNTWTNLYHVSWSHTPTLMVNVASLWILPQSQVQPPNVSKPTSMNGPRQTHNLLAPLAPPGT